MTKYGVTFNDCSVVYEEKKEVPMGKIMLCGQLVCTICHFVMIDFNIGEFVSKRYDESKDYLINIPEAIACPECGNK